MDQLIAIAIDVDSGHLFEDLSRRFRGSFTIARSATYLQIGPAGVDKGVALQRLIPHVGMGTGVIAAVGDSVNDVPMFSAAGVSIAVNPDSSDVAAAATLHVSGDGALFSALRTLEAWFFEHHVS